MRWFKNIFAGEKEDRKPKQIIITPQSEVEVPRYPPFMRGLPAIAPEKLLGAQHEILEQVSRSVQVSKDLYEKYYLGALLRFASYAHLLPASQTHHHRGAGGLLRHSMEAALWSMQGGEKVLLGIGKTPAQRRKIEPRWQLMTFLAGLCHDAGKPATDIIVSNGNRLLSWKPIKENLFDWAQENNVDAYFLDWRPGRAKQHVALSNLISERIIGVDALAWIEEGGTDLIVWLMESLNGNPGSNNPLYDLVLKSDQSSVERDLKSMGVAMAGYEIGIPVERHLTDIMRRLIKEGIWRINEPGARVWKIDGCTYIVWPAGGEEIARVVADDGIPGFPRTSGGVLDMLVERNLAFTKDAEKPGDDIYWKIAPQVLAEKIPDISLLCIKLGDDALISSIPLESVPGKVLNSDSEDLDEEDVSPKIQEQSSIQAAQSKEDVGVEQTSQGKDHGAAASIIVTNNGAASQVSKSAEGVTSPSKATFVVDDETGEIKKIKVIDADGAAISVDVLKPQRVGKGKNELSRPTLIRSKTSDATGIQDDADADPCRAIKDGSSVLDGVKDGFPENASDNLTQKKRGKKGGPDTSAPPTMTFDGAVGAMFMALAEDIKTGAKSWGKDAILDEESMVRLNWPSAFAGYGLTQKLILDECKQNDWLWADPYAPMVRLIDATFDGREGKALRLNQEASYAFIYHAGLPRDSKERVHQERENRSPNDAAERVSDASSGDINGATPSDAKDSQQSQSVSIKPDALTANRSGAMQQHSGNDAQKTNQTKAKSAKARKSKDGAPKQPETDARNESSGSASNEEQSPDVDAKQGWLMRGCAP